MRHAHFIKRNHETTTPTYAIWFDTETRNDKRCKDKIVHILTFGWAAFARKRSNGKWDKPEWKRFETADQFFAWVEGKKIPKTKLYLFCHNTSFDIPVLDAFRNFALRGWKLTMACIDAPPTICKLRKDNTTICILDTLNIFRMSLKALGGIIGLEKYDMPDISISSAEGDRYCKRDVEIIMKACMRWWQLIEDNDLGGFAPTLAGQAMRAFRHRFMSHKILIDNHEKATAVSRRSYYGGRTECFRLGHIKEHTTLLDVNSMYPAVMRAHDYPCRLLGHTRKASLCDLKEWLKSRCLSADVTLRSTENAYPFRTPERLLFPLGRYRTSLSTPEILRALARNDIEEVHEVAIYEKAPVFADFVNYFYNMRLLADAETRTAEALMYKTLLNSLYGKFGQRGLIWETTEQTDDLSARIWEEKDAETGKIYRHRQLGGIVQVQYNETESKDSFPAIAAHVTAYARLLLYDMINTAGKGNVYYVDTDSLLVNDRGLGALDRYIDPNKLGSLKIEGSYDDVEIFGAKDYRFGSKERHKGVKKNAVWLSANQVRQDQWSSLKGLLATGHLSRPSIKKVTKTLSREYTKGTVLPSGYIEPFRLTGTE